MFEEEPWSNAYYGTLVLHAEMQKLASIVSVLALFLGRRGPHGIPLSDGYLVHPSVCKKNLTYLWSCFTSFANLFAVLRTFTLISDVLH